MDNPIMFKIQVNSTEEWRENQQGRKGRSERGKQNSAAVLVQQSEFLVGYMGCGSFLRNRWIYTRRFFFSEIEASKGVSRA